MQLRLGQNLFGALIGVVTAAGLAGAVAVASGKMEVRKRIPLTPAAASAQVQGKVYRTTKGKAQGASASASTTSIPKAFKKGKGLASVIAQANGWAHSDFKGYGEAVTHGYMNGFPIRLAKLRPISAKGYASAFGQGFVFQIMQPMEARAVASGYGTTYHLGYGHAACIAQVTGRGAWQIGVAGEAVGYAQLDGWVHYKASMYPAIGWCDADARSEPAVRINGVRHFETWGTAEAHADAVLTNWAYYPSVTAVARAYAQLTARYTLGGQGHGQAGAELFGTMIGASTSAGVVQSDSIAVASGQLRSFPKGYGTATCSSSGSGDAVIKKTGLGRCEGIARCVVAQGIDAVVINTKADPDDGYGVAMGMATMNRIRFMSGRASETVATTYAKSVKTQSIHGVGNGIARFVGSLFKTSIAKAMPVKAEATLTAEMQFNVTPPPAVANAQLDGVLKKDLYVSGEARAVATAVGGNQVNDAVKAPATRTVILTTESRTSLVLAESRTMVV